MARQLDAIVEDLKERPHSDTDQYFIFNFIQIWASTALGFGGVGGSALTPEMTYVIIPRVKKDEEEYAHVYFGSKYAYTIKTNDVFWEDVEDEHMASCLIARTRYKS